MTLECAVGADVGAGIGDDIVGDRVVDFVGAVMASVKLPTASLESIWCLPVQSAKAREAS